MASESGHFLDPLQPRWLQIPLNFLVIRIKILCHVFVLSVGDVGDGEATQSNMFHFHSVFGQLYAKY